MDTVTVSGLESEENHDVWGETSNAELLLLLGLKVLDRNLDEAVTRPRRKLDEHREFIMVLVAASEKQKDQSLKIKMRMMSLEL
jgi:hypothetical protein